jgi:hypothetical protein
MLLGAQIELGRCCSHNKKPPQVTKACCHQTPSHWGVQTEGSWNEYVHTQTEGSPTQTAMRNFLLYFLFFSFLALFQFLISLYFPYSLYFTSIFFLFYFSLSHYFTFVNFYLFSLFCSILLPFLPSLLVLWSFFINSHCISESDWFVVVAIVCFLPSEWSCRWSLAQWTRWVVCHYRATATVEKFLLTPAMT